MLYFDNAATSFPKPETVYEEVNRFMREIGVSAGRGAYQRGRKASKVIDNTRQSLARLFNIENEKQIVFTHNITESLNLALKGFLKKNDHVVTTDLEHNAVWRPLKALEKEKNIKISVVPCPDGCAPTVDDFAKFITPEVSLVALTHASNVTGAIMPLEEIANLCTKNDVKLLVDTAQTAGVYPLDIKKTKIDLLAFTGHKGLLGPTGTGGLYITEGLELKPLKEGGTGADSLSTEQPAYMPDRYETGTINAMGIAGLGAGVNFILEQGIDNIWKHEKEITRKLYHELQKISGIKLYGPQENQERVAVISFNLATVPPQDVAYVLDEIYEIMVRSGLHCSPLAHKSIGTEEMGTVRIAPGYFTEEKDIEQLISALQTIAEQTLV